MTTQKRTTLANRPNRQLVTDWVSDHPWLTGLCIIAVLSIPSFFLADQPLARFFRSPEAPFKSFFARLDALGDSSYSLVPSLAGWLIFSYVCRQPDIRMRLPFDTRRVALQCAFVFSCVASSGIAVNILKILFGRARCVVLFESDTYGFHFFRLGYDFASFPSGHATTAIALATALIYLAPRASRWLIPLFIAAAFSRVAVTAHFLSDVLVGGFLGAWMTWLWREAFRQRGWLFSSDDEPWSSVYTGPFTAWSTLLRERDPDQSGYR
ncbi:MAG: phosphatase PAP2 family protein [Pseudomonadota bacterium]|nr:phosphatase PAP2 family protein [Pseudomonadota bacterium]